MRTATRTRSGLRFAFAVLIQGVTQSLQALLREQLAELPRMIAGQLVRDKLEPLGLAANEQVVGALVARILCDTGDGSFHIEADVPEGTLPNTVSLSFGDEDVAFIARAEEAFRAELPDLIKSTAKRAATAMIDSYGADWPAWRSVVVAETEEFRENIEARWQAGFDLLRMLIEISREQGMDFDRRARRSRSVKHAHLNAALTHLHARALQIASEVMVLMESGFADGAMARWRTLYEVTCVAMVLNDGGNDLALRYLEHDAVECKKGLGQYQQCHAALGFPPFSARDTRKIERAYAAAIAKYGKEFGGDYGWVAAHIGVARPNFSQIEAAAGRAMMRTYYKMASQNVHAGAKGITSRLSTFEGGFTAIAGASNVGFAEPGQNLGLSLLHFTTLLLPRRWTLDRIALLMAMNDLNDRVGPALIRSQKRIVRDEGKIRRLLAEGRANPRNANNQRSRKM